MPKEKEEKLHEKYYFYYWNEAIGEMRLVTSWDTTEEDVDGLIEYVKRL
jgi:threonine aldolase